MEGESKPRTVGYYGAEYTCVACGGLWYGYIDLTDEESRYCPECCQDDEDDDGTRYGHCEDCYAWVEIEYIDNQGNRVNIATSPLLCEDCAALHEQRYQRYLNDLRRSPQHGFIYLLDSQVGYWKIGRSGVPVQRIGKLEVVLPFELDVVALIETANMYVMESKLHQRYAAKRVRGEWFRLETDDIAYIKSLVGIPAWHRRIEQMVAEEEALWQF